MNQNEMKPSQDWGSSTESAYRPLKAASVINH